MGGSGSSKRFAATSSIGPNRRRKVNANEKGRACLAAYCICTISQVGGEREWFTASWSSVVGVYDLLLRETRGTPFCCGARLNCTTPPVRPTHLHWTESLRGTSAHGRGRAPYRLFRGAHRVPRNEHSMRLTARANRWCYGPLARCYLPCVTVLFSTSLR